MYEVEPVTTHPAEKACDLVLDKAGASYKRDAVDLRIVEEVRSGKSLSGKNHNGIGIRNSLLTFWSSHARTDLEAIKWAMTPGISGTTRKEGGTEDNAGAGLFFIKSRCLLS